LGAVSTLCPVLFTSPTTLTLPLIHNTGHSFSSTRTGPELEVVVVVVVVVVIKRQFIRRRNMAIESLQGRRTIFAARTPETVSQ